MFAHIRDSRGEHTHTNTYAKLKQEGWDGEHFRSRRPLLVVHGVGVLDSLSEDSELRSEGRTTESLSNRLVVATQMCLIRILITSRGALSIP